MKNTLITSGYPRSGNTYLNQALNLLYYPKDSPGNISHRVNVITNNNLVLVPFRKPIDSIASWNDFERDAPLKPDIKFYIRFNTAVLDNVSKVVLMNFDFFIKDIDYIKNRVLKNFGLISNENVTDKDIKKTMLIRNKAINLPRNNQEKQVQVKQLLPNIEDFGKCLELYAELINAHEKQTAICNQPRSGTIKP